MFLRCLATIVFDFSGQSDLSKGQKEELSPIWNAIKVNTSEHAKIIRTKFYCENPECLEQFYDFGNDAVRNFIEDVLNAVGSTVEYGLQCPEKFAHPPENISIQGFGELNKILADYLLEQVGSMKTIPLVDALKTFFLRIESNFKDSSESTQQEI